jgi:hypothetical protein
MKVTKWVVAGLVVLGLALPAWADITSQLAGYDGPMTLKFTNWDVGTLYSGMTPGVTYTGAALAALPQQAPPNSFNGESSWGIAQLTTIKGTVGGNPNYVLWSGTQLGTQQVTAIFWGETDTSVTLNADGTESITGNGYHIAFFENPSSDPNSINPIATTTAGRTAADVFTGMAQAGYTCIWTLNSVPGANANDMSDQFFGTYTPETAFGGLNAGGAMYADTGTIYEADLPGGQLTGVDNGMFAPISAGGPDWDVNWTGTSLLGPTGGGFDVNSEDPVYTEAVPAPAAVVLGMMGLGLVGWYRKRAA